MKATFAAAIALLLTAPPAMAWSTAARQFQRAHPCPATGERSGPCPGWIRDHIVPLACGGADAPENMQWQSVADAKAKDRWERKSCAGLHIGMSDGEVVVAWGAPDRLAAAVTLTRTFEEWLYAGRATLIFEDGRLIAIGR